MSLSGARKEEDDDKNTNKTQQRRATDGARRPMMPPEETLVPARTVSAAEVQTIKHALAAHIDALVAAAHTPKDGVLVAGFRPDMTFIAAQVTPNGELDVPAQGAPAGYLVRLCPIVAWRPWRQRDIEAAIEGVQATAIFPDARPALA